MFLHYRVAGESLKPVGKVLGIVRALQRAAVPCGLLADCWEAEREPV